MRYAFQNDRYIPKNKIYNNISLSPYLRNDLKFSSNNYYTPFNINNIRTPENAKLSYNINSRNLAKNNNFPYIFNQAKDPTIESYSNFDKLPYINPNLNNRINNYYSGNYEKPTLVYGLPVIVPKAMKLKNVLTPNKYPKTRKMKKNFSNLECRNLVKEIVNINTPPKINSLEIDDEGADIKNMKKNNFFHIMTRSKTEEHLDENINPFYNEEIKKDPRKKWWKLLRYFVEVYYFFSVFRKYTKKIKPIRDKEINQMEEKLLDECMVIRNWILGMLDDDYWKKILIFKDINVTFTEFYSVKKMSKYSKDLIGFINDFLYNLKIKTNDIKQIPEDVQKLLYRYIKKNAYFPREYMNLFHIKRLNFDFYGSCINNTLEESAMILCYFVISCISVQQIFLRINHIFPELKPYENIYIASKYIASILYYLERNAFVKATKTNNNYIDIFNYYRSYNLKNDAIEKENNIKVLLGISKNVSIIKFREYLSNDIYNKLLVDDKSIDKFWENNFRIMKKISNSLFVWSINLAKKILDKHEKKK